VTTHIARQSAARHSRTSGTPSWVSNSVAHAKRNIVPHSRSAQPRLLLARTSPAPRANQRPHRVPPPRCGRDRLVGRSPRCNKVSVRPVPALARLKARDSAAIPGRSAFACRQAASVAVSARVGGVPSRQRRHNTSGCVGRGPALRLPSSFVAALQSLARRGSCRAGPSPCPRERYSLEGQRVPLESSHIDPLRPAAAGRVRKCSDRSGRNRPCASCGQSEVPSRHRDKSGAVNRSPQQVRIPLAPLHVSRSRRR